MTDKSYGIKRGWPLGSGQTSFVPSIAYSPIIPPVGAPVFPNGSIVITIGDSIIQHGNASTSGINTMLRTDQSETIGAQALDPRFRHDNFHSTDSRGARYFTGANHGISSDTCAGVLARIGDAIAMRPAMINVIIGTNSITDLTNLQACYDAVINAGIFLGCGTVRPWAVTKSGDNAGSRQNRLDMNTFTRNYVLSKGPSLAYLIDWDLVYDPTATGYGPTSWYYPDGLHPLGLGATTAAAFLQTVISQFFVAGNWFFNTYWGTGNVLTNYQFAGITGTLGPNTLGVVPTSWTLGAASTNASMCMASLAANPTTGFNSLVMDITAAGTSVNERFEFKPSATITVAGLGGQWIQGFAEVQYDGNPMWALLNLQVFDGTDATQNNQSFSSPTAPLGINPVAKTYTIATDPFPSPTGATTFKVIAQQRYIPLGNNGTARVIIKRIWFGIVPDPRPLYGIGVAPGQVTGLTLGTATSTTQPLSWTAPSSGGAPATYTVEVSPAGAGTWTPTTGVTGTTYTVTGLTASTSYDYRVTAVNTTGSGTASTVATGTTAASGGASSLILREDSGYVLREDGTRFIRET